MFIGGGNVWYVIGISIAVIALCFVGSLIGMLIARELRRAGKLK
jgi:ABC-type multidrug transport system permease subunit